jgi:hypothetical protein
MELGLADLIRTGADGSASVILYESAIVTLEADTEVKLAELSKDNSVVQQNSGSTWNKFTKMNGMKGLEVETPNSVATVRGTEFGVDMDNVTVIEGEVATTDKLSGQVYSVPAGQKATRLEGKLALGDLSEDEKARVISKMEKNVKRLEHLAEKQSKKQTGVEKVLGKQSGKAKNTLAKVEESKKDIADTKAGKLKGPSKSNGHSKESAAKESTFISDGSSDDVVAQDDYSAKGNKNNKKPQITGIAIESEDDAQVYAEDSKSQSKNSKKD